ncbi:GNAT family N-acetyltransferase [Microbacteriaceae bacterium 4G12]
MVFQNERLIVRNLTEEDKHLLANWLSNPTVLEFYEGRDNPHDIDKVNQHFYVGTDEVSRCIVKYEGEAIGYIQFYPLDNQSKITYGYDKNQVIYGTDQFIGESAFWNRGIGKLLVSSMVGYLSTVKKVDKIVMDPQAWNERAICCYERCGFKKVKLLLQHEMHEGELKGCWLIEYRNKQ